MKQTATVRKVTSQKEAHMHAETMQRFGVLYKLSSEDRLEICQQIAEACEQSFRRGFSQGYAGCGEVVVDVEDWRFNTPLSDSPSPHGTYDSDALHRHANEVGLPIHQSLWRCMFDEPPPRDTPILAWNVVKNRDGSTVERVITATVTSCGFITAGEKSRGEITHWRPMPGKPE